MRRRRAIRCLMRQVRTRQRTEVSVMARATRSRWSRFVPSGCGRRVSDLDGRQQVRAARPGREMFGVYGRRLHWRRAHTSGSYPA
eukprot:2571427-Pleurochrysis_carterae.AAC.1